MESVSLPPFKQDPAGVALHISDLLMCCKQINPESASEIASSCQWTRSEAGADADKQDNSDIQVNFNCRL